MWKKVKQIHVGHRPVLVRPILCGSVAHRKSMSVPDAIRSIKTCAREKNWQGALLLLREGKGRSPSEKLILYTAAISACEPLGEVVREVLERIRIYYTIYRF